MPTLGTGVPGNIAMPPNDPMTPRGFDEGVCSCSRSEREEDAGSGPAEAAVVDIPQGSVVLNTGVLTVACSSSRSSSNSRFLICSIPFVIQATKSTDRKLNHS